MHKVRPLEVLEVRDGKMALFFVVGRCKEDIDEARGSRIEDTAEVGLFDPERMKDFQLARPRFLNGAKDAAAGVAFIVTQKSFRAFLGFGFYV